MNYAVLDFETTGFEANDEIIQVGLVTLDEGQINTRYSSLIKPSKSIPSSITQLTGISDDMVQSAPAMEDVMAELLPLLANRILVAHNASFDLAFLQRALDACGYASFDGLVVDTIPALRICYPGLTSLQLSMVCESLDIALSHAHQADSDAEATAAVWLKCLDRLETLPLLTVQRLAQLFTDANSPTHEGFAYVLQQLRTEKELQTSIDLDGSKYYRQFAINVGDWQDEQNERTNLDDELFESFDEFYNQMKQALQHEFAYYEQRSSQDDMIHEVYEAFEGEQHLMIEAGTGTGKSLGYLIPSLFYGLRQKRQVIVSTHTINLQEQIRQRDIPLLQRIFPVPFRAALLKGRNHYLCLRKFEHKINGLDFEHVDEDTVTAAQMIVWLGETEHGDEEELYFGYKGKPFWSTVASDTESCLNRACPWFKKCFYHRAKHQANIADVIITNHSMLFTDVKADHRLLPEYEQLVIDEAHHLEEVANKHLGLNVQYYAFVNALTWLYKDSRTGLLPALKVKLQHNEDDLSEEICRQIDELYPMLIKAREGWEQLSELLYQVIEKRSGVQEGGAVLRIKAKQLPADWDTLVAIEDNIYIELSDSLKIIERLIEKLKENQDAFDVQSLITDMGGVLQDVYRMRDELHFFMHINDEEYVYWLEASPSFKHKSIQLIAVPVDVSPKLRQYFFDNKESIILTSATLSVDQSFQYTSEQLGLSPALDTGKLRTVQLSSPFNYREQALVCIPRDFPKLQGSQSDSAFIERLIESLSEIALTTKGRMLVLFTSYRMLRQVHEQLSQKLAASKIQVLGQGIESSNRSKLIHMFQNGSASILLGTSSFWEGVDIPGEALSCLAIVRLPFQPPNHPLAEAKSELIKQNNQNPFMKLSVPQAVIRFKQGFGRLVRNAQDQGVVIIYDTRVIDSKYGRHFLYSLPGPRIEHMPAAQMASRVKQWLNKEE